MCNDQTNVQIRSGLRGRDGGRGRRSAARPRAGAGCASRTAQLSPMRPEPLAVARLKSSEEALHSHF
eukprot:7310184-Prymnesium_polylepis.1